MKCHLPKPGSVSWAIWRWTCVYTSACRYAGPGPRPRAVSGSSQFSFWFLAGEKPSAYPWGLYVIWGVEEWVNEWVCFLSWGTHVFTSSDRKLLFLLTTHFPPSPGQTAPVPTGASSHSPTGRCSHCTLKQKASPKANWHVMSCVEKDQHGEFWHHK